jgi:hypothetical protein
MPSFTFKPGRPEIHCERPDGATPERAFAILQGWMRGNQKAEAPSAAHGHWGKYAAQSSEDGPWTKYQGRAASESRAWRAALSGLSRAACRSSVAY